MHGESDTCSVLLGSAVEVVALAGVAFYAWTWPKLPVAGVAVHGDGERRQHTAV